MHILALILLAIVLAGCIAFGIFLLMARIGHKKAWKEYIEHDRQRRERRGQADAVTPPFPAGRDDASA